MVSTDLSPLEPYFLLYGTANVPAGYYLKYRSPCLFSGTFGDRVPYDRYGEHDGRRDTFERSPANNFRTLFLRTISLNRFRFARAFRHRCILVSLHQYQTKDFRL